MEISYTSLVEVQEIEPNDNLAIISIRDKGYSYNLKNHKYMLILEFYDTDPNKHEITNQRLFNQFDLVMIKNFLSSLPVSVTKIVVHCYAGFSRSPAIAKALSVKYGYNLIESGFPTNPNKFVYDLIMNSN